MESQASLDIARDAMLLYNSRDQRRVNTINRALLDSGITTWFSPEDLKPGQLTDWLKFEQDVLTAARTVVVFLGEAGWGPQHKTLTEAALRQEKRLIPVLLERASDEAMSDLNGLFRDLLYIDFQAGEEDGTRRLIRAIKENEPPPPPQPKRRPTASVNAARVVARLFEGDDDDRAETLDELATFARTHDLSPVAAELLKRLPELGAERSVPAPIRVSVLSALALTYEEDRPDSKAIGDAINPHMEAATESDASVRFGIWSGVYRVVPEDEKDNAPEELEGDPDPSVKALAKAIHSRKNIELQSEIRGVLDSGDRDAVNPLLKALRVVTIPALIPSICALFTQQPDELTIYALTEPDVIIDAAIELQRISSSPDIARCVAGLQSPGRYLTRRVTSLLGRMDQEKIRAELMRLAAEEGSSGSAALLLKALNEAFGRLRIAGYSSDSIEGVHDDLNVHTEVQTLCSVVVSKDVEPPLSIGLFGDWGAGKSFFMDRMYDEVGRLGSLSTAEGDASRFHSKVAQIRFNAWHYIDANLWASLVSHIIEELARQVKPEQDAAVARKALVSQLDTAQELKNEAKAEKRRAEQARTAAEKNLSTIAENRADKQIQLTDLRTTDFWRLAQKDKDFRDAFTNAAKELGLPSALGSLEELQVALMDAHGTAGRIRALALSVTRTKSRMTLVALIAFVLLGVPAIVAILNHWLTDQKVFTATAAILADIGAAALACAKFIRKPLKRVNDALAKLDDARAKAAKIIEEKRKQRSKGEIDLEKQLNELKAKEASATQQLTTAESRIQEINAKIREIDEGRSLAKYLLERFQAEDYRKHLGLVSTIRRDFENLSKLLNIAAKEVKAEPIQRIILYVDDLDRCPPARVMEVLQAVHLLLAFKLFVVVVGVDPRWLLHALEKSYTAFQVKGRGRGREWITTPQNYLEKIFQIPFSLRPMERDGFERLIKTLLPPDSPSNTPRMGEAAHPRKAEVKTMAAGVGAGASGGGTSVEMSDPAAGEKIVEEGSTERYQADNPQNVREKDQSQSNEKSKEESKEESQRKVQEKNSGKQDEPPSLNYDALRIQPWESDFAARLFSFVPSPRAAKRFSNIYRLLKAPLNEEQLSRFEGTKAAPGEFRAAMILLAVLTGFPDSSAEVFKRVRENQAASMPPKDFFRDAAKAGARKTDEDRFRTCVEPLLSDGFTDEMAPFSTWSFRVARFSFESTRGTRTLD